MSHPDCSYCREPAEYQIETGEDVRFACERHETRARVEALNGTAPEKESTDK